MRLSSGGSAGAALSAGLGSIDAVFNPAAARAREELDQQHERVVPVPSPGDRILDDGVIVIALSEKIDVSEGGKTPRTGRSAPEPRCPAPGLRGSGRTPPRRG